MASPADAQRLAGARPRWTSRRPKTETPRPVDAIANNAADSLESETAGGHHNRCGQRFTTAAHHYPPWKQRTTDPEHVRPVPSAPLKQYHRRCSPATSQRHRRCERRLGNPRDDRRSWCSECHRAAPLHLRVLVNEVLNPAKTAPSALRLREPSHQYLHVNCRRTPGISCEAVPASMPLPGAGMRRHVRSGAHDAESFVSFIPLFGGAPTGPRSTRVTPLDSPCKCQE